MSRFLVKMWNLGQGDVPYPRREGESREAWYERIYAQLELDVPDSVYWLGEESAAYLFGFSVSNALWRAFLVAVPVVVILMVILEVKS